jgi:hypothetical protein
MRIGLQVTVDLFPGAHPRMGRYTARDMGDRQVTDTPAERAAESTWTRLRRRNMVQWGLAYVPAAWGFLQGAGVRQ